MYEESIKKLVDDLRTQYEYHIEFPIYVVQGFNSRNANGNFVSAHLTEKSAQEYIDTQSHRYLAELKITIYSMSSCPEMIALRKWLISGEPMRVMEERDALKQALLHIKEHQESLCKGDMKYLSTTWTIAERALKKLEREVICDESF